MPSFYVSPSARCSFQTSLESFALDLLYGELILKQCDRYSPVHVAYDDDCNLISIMVPNLFKACSELESAMEQNGDDHDEATKKKFSIFKIRCNWLLAGFYLWRSRIARSIWEAQEAEEEGTAFIEEALKGFSPPCLRQIKSLPTPHLASPGRTESYWKEISPTALAKYRDEIQASSVVSLVRGKFQDLIAAMDRRSESTEVPVNVSDEDAKALVEIGETLFDRYKSGYGDEEAKHSELVENFLSVHGNDIISSSRSEGQNDFSSISLLIPLERLDPASLRKMSNPSILSMLVVCMNMKQTNQFLVMQLLVRLVLSTKDTHSVLLQRIHDAKATRNEGDDDDFSDSDDDSMMSDDSEERNTSNKNMDEKRAMQCGHLVAFLVHRICEGFSKCLSTEEKQLFIADEECRTLVRCSLELSSHWFEATAKHFEPEDLADLLIFRSVSSLMILLCTDLTPVERHKFDAQYLQYLTKILISHRKVFAGLVHNHGDRSTRITKQKLCIKRTEYVNAVVSEIGILMSHYQGKVQKLVMVQSDICVGFPNSEWNYFIDSVLWFWKYASQNLSENQGTGPPVVACSSFDRPIVKCLRVPVAIIVVALCGSAASSRTNRGEPVGDSEDPLCLSEFYDSDESANDWLSDDEEPDDESQKRRELLRVLCHAVQCITLVLDKIDDKEALSVVSQSRCKDLGPVFPLVASRVLNRFADSLLQNFVDENQDEPNLWSEEYPVGTRTIGEILDSNLHKVLRWLYGFVLVGEKAHLQSSGKDLAMTATPILDLAVRDCHLENVSAAAQLYRCIVRAYSTGRRSPPKKALELVSSALPPLEETEKSRALESFLFNTSEPYLSLDQIASLVRKDDNWETPFAPIGVHLVSSDEQNNPKHLSQEKEEIMRVRRGILSELAGGQLPISINEAGKGKSDQAPDDDRVATIKNEEEISKKFEAILGDLCLGDAENSQGWYRAAQCVSTKAELIADRLGLSKGFARSTDFAIPLPEPRSVQGIDRRELEEAQEEEDALINANWIHYLGSDLSVYARFSWASFDSLQACSDEIGKACRTLPSEDGKRSQRLIWRSIDSLYKKGDYLGWQEAWGGIFVFALRKLAVRFMSVALYLLLSKTEQDAEDKVLISELCESLGMILYSDLMGSQNYGYPMRAMGPKRKRDLASASRACFRAAADIVEEPSSDDDGSDDETQATWDLLFMIGKVRFLGDATAHLREK